MSIVLKIRKDGDIRRITVSRGITYLELQKLSSQLFNEQTPLVLKYRDEENDLITISNDIELQEAFQFHQEGRPLNLEVVSSSNASQQPNQSPHPSQQNNASNDGLKFFQDLVQQYQPLVNDFLQQLQSQTSRSTSNPNDNSSGNTFSEELPIHNAHCDSCGEQIVGWRFKCNSCPDYDLCQLCIGKTDVHNSSHQFTTIEKPERSFAGPWNHCRRSYHPYANSYGCQWN